MTIPREADHEMVKDVLRSLPAKDDNGDQICNDAKKWNAEHDWPVDPIGEAGIQYFLTLVTTHEWGH
jgi:hypothetical protein